MNASRNDSSLSFSKTPITDRLRIECATYGEYAPLLESHRLLEVDCQRAKSDAIEWHEDYDRIKGELDKVTADRAKLIAALELFADLDKTVNSDLWAINKSYCEQARAALAKARA